VDALENSYLQFDQPPAARRALLDGALTAVRQAGYARGKANTLQALGDLEVREAHYGAARARYEAALTLFQAIPARLGEANTLQALGALHQAEGDLEGGGASFAAAAALYAAIGLPREEAVMKGMFAQLRLAQGRLDEAIALIRAALEVFEARDLAQDVHVTRGIIARFAAAMPDFAARWQALAGEPPPAWLRDMLAAKELLARLVEWIQTPDWPASRDALRAHAGELLTDAAEAVLGQLAQANPGYEGVAAHVALLRLCREHGIDAGYAAFLSGGDTPAAAS